MIAFDIDGCMNNIKEDIARIGSNFFSQYSPVIHREGYYLREIFPGLPEELYEKFWDEYGYEIYTNPPKDYVFETVDYIRHAGLKACIITTRDTDRRFSGRDFKEITDEWLQKYNIGLPVYYEKNKHLLVRSLGVELMVEDKPGNILKLQEVTDVLIFRHPYNQNMHGRFVDNWQQVLDCIKTGAEPAFVKMF